jgi:hypothetical protein
VINFTNIVNENIHNTSASKTWGGHDRSQTIGASEIGGCLRRLVYSKHGVEQDADFFQDLGAAERGNVIEDWLDNLLKGGLPDNVKIIWSGKKQKTLVHGKQSATPDGLLLSTDGDPFEIEIDGQTYKGTCVYLEIKSIDPRPFDNLSEPKAQHVTQCRQGMHLTYITSKNKYAPKFAVIIYVNASFLNQIKVFKVDMHTDIAQHLEVRANSVWSDYTPDKLPIPEGKIEGGKECMYCAWRKRCQNIEVSSIPTNENSNYVEAVEHRVRDLAIKRKELFAVTKSDGVRLKEIDQEIMEVLREADTRKVSGDWGSVTAFSAKSPPRYDKALFEKQGLDPKEFQTSGDYSSRLNISLKY